MLIGTFTSKTGWAGKTVEYDEDGRQYTLQDYGLVSARQVLKYENPPGDFEWASAEARAIVEAEASVEAAGATELVRRGDEEFAQRAAAEAARRTVADAELETYALTGAVATFRPESEHSGKRIVLEDGAFVLEGYGPLTVVEIAAFDRRGELTWTFDGLRTAVNSDAAFAEMPAKAQETLARNMEPGLLDFVIVGARSQCLVALPTSCIVVKPGTFTSLESCMQFAYSDITGISLREVNVEGALWIPVLEVTTSAYPASPLGSNYDTQPKRAPNCLPLAEKEGAVTLGNCSAQMDELRRRAGLLEPPGNAIARVPCCQVMGGEGLGLPVDSAHDMVFCRDELLLRRSVDGLPEMSIAYADITLLEVGLPSGVISPGATSDGYQSPKGVLSQAWIHQRSGVWARITLQTRSGELFLNSRYEPQAAIRKELSPVFNILRQRQLEKSADGAQTPRDDVVARVEKLVELHDAGNLSDEEFAAFKVKLME